MSIKIEISNEIDEKEWNKKLLENKNSTTYQTPNWSKVYETVYGSKPVFIAARNSKGEIIGQLSAVIHNRYFWVKSNIISQKIGIKFNLRSILHWFYGPIIHDYSLQNEITSEILKAIENLAIKHKVTMIRGTSIPTESNSDQLFKTHAYTIDHWATYKIDLKQSIDDLYNSLNKKTRYDIRKSEKNDLEFEIADNRSALDEYLDLKYEAMARSGEQILKSKNRKSLATKFNDAHWKYLHKKGLKKLFLVRHESELLGAISNLTFNGNMYQHGVGNSSKTELLGGSFLTWNTIKWAIENHYSSYDVGGINPSPSSIKEKQIDFYKSKWGGKRLEYLVYTKILDNLKIKISSFLENPKKVSRKISSILYGNST